MKTTAIALALGTFIAAPIGIHVSGLIMNYTDSVPVGLYRRVPSNSPNQSAEYAGFCLPSAIATAALRAGLESVHGGCTGGIAPILKPLIYPSPAHPLIYTSQGFSVDGKMLPNTTPKPRSRTGATLEHYPFGVYISGAWAVSTYNADSFDSRYFGPIAPDTIRFYAEPVWMF